MGGGRGREEEREPRLPSPRDAHDVVAHELRVEIRVQRPRLLVRVDAPGVETVDHDHRRVRRGDDCAQMPHGVVEADVAVVLADGDTASSAEIVTGAIQDAKRAQVVGEKTFGTGTVLGRFDLADGSSLRIGVERWLTRNGRPIWHEGLEPDVNVTLADTVQPVVPDTLRGMSAADLAKSPDLQLLKALELLQGKG